jgi:hypothetical protein
MALKYTLKRAEVIDGGDVVATVRGLSLNDMTDLMQINAEAMDLLFEQFRGREPDSISEIEVSGIGVSLLKSAPVIVAQIIATATDAYSEYEEAEGRPTPMDVIMAMPTGTQMACLEKIGELTFNAGFDPKKLIALALSVMKGAGQG